MVIGIIVPDGVGIKNYLYTDLPHQLLADEANRLVLIHSELDPVLLHNIAAPFGNRVQLAPLPPYQETSFNRILREAISIARLKYFSKKLNNPTIYTNAAPTPSNHWRRRMLLTLTHTWAQFMRRGYSNILKHESWHNHRLSKTKVLAQTKLLQHYGINALISLHQRPPENIGMYEAARRLGIRRYAAIYSWDNVAKARLYTPAHAYLLWSAYMREQMQLFYPEIPAESLVITGTPQFSFYFNPKYLSPKAAFFARHGLDLNRTLVIFSGSDKRTSPYDEYLLRDVCQALRNWPEAERPQLVFRRTPADFSNRYDAIFAQYPEIKVMDPKWINHGNSWATAVPTEDDISNIVGLIQHGDVVINVASTMALDAATHNKPCIYLSYHPAEAQAMGYPLYNNTHDEDHFKVMKQMDAVVYVGKQPELAQKIQAVLQQPDEYATGRKQYLYAITNDLHNTATAEIAKTLLQSSTHY